MVASQTGARLSTNRDARFDAVRGALLVAMACNHVVNPLILFTDHPLGWVSAAEGFVFLAGLVGALVFARRQARDPRSVLPAARQRVATIYRWHVGTFLAVLGWSLAWRAWSGAAPGEIIPGPPALLQTAPGGAALAGVTLLHQPPLLDILSMYCALFATVPLLVAACAAGRAWLALLVSAALWSVTQVLGSPAPVAFGWINLGAFHWSAWQWLFVAGFVIGWRRTEGETFRPRLWLAVPAAVLVALCTAQRHEWMPFLWSSPDIIATTNKNLLAPLRLANFALIAYLVASVATWWPRVAAWAPLAAVGRHALPVFAGQILLATVLNSFPVLSSSFEIGWVSTLLILGSIAATVTVAEAWGRRDTPREAEGGASRRRGRTHSPTPGTPAHVLAWSSPASRNNSRSSSKSID